MANPYKSTFVEPSSASAAPIQDANSAALAATPRVVARAAGRNRGDLSRVMTAPWGQDPARHPHGPVGRRWRPDARKLFQPAGPGYCLLGKVPALASRPGPELGQGQLQGKLTAVRARGSASS